ncbi:carcinoembryonic antigen-related cell adhesion molecule 5-like [Hoplias malabaricus]|uniref:carcinoembryonic antigen-related cell adhesion molecule 5-like n=1 Tax=Hoplias malabaricus TaxID=27720 RepID=UPI00346219D2
MGSAYINLLIFTGLFPVFTAGIPSMVEISGPKEVIAGVSSVFECSAVCSGTCVYTWEVDGHSGSGSRFTVLANGISTYISVTCTVKEPKGQNPFTKVISVKVINPISVNPSRDQPLLNRDPKVGRPFNLTCEGATPAVTVIWLKDGQPLSLNSTMSVSPGNSTLSFSRLEVSDAGQYQCMVNKGIAKVFSKGYWIYFGYVVVDLSGPNQVELGLESEFRCNAKCGVDCSVQWSLQAGFPRGKFTAEGSRIRWTPSEVGQTQVFTCLTLNAASGILGQVSKPVTVVEARPRPTTSNAICVKSSGAILISATLLMLLFAWA